MAGLLIRVFRLRQRNLYGRWRGADSTTGATSAIWRGRLLDLAAYTKPSAATTAKPATTTAACRDREATMIATITRPITAQRAQLLIPTPDS